MWQDALIAELDGEALEGPLEAEEDHLVEAEDDGDIEQAEDTVGGEVTEEELEELEALRSSLQRRYEEVQLYSEQSAKAVLSAQARQMTALSSPALEMLVRLLHHPFLLSINSVPPPHIIFIPLPPHIIFIPLPIPGEAQEGPGQRPEAGRGREDRGEGESGR